MKTLLQVAVAITLLFAALALSVDAGFSVSDVHLHDESSDLTYKLYTTAVCDEGFCEDYVIEERNGEIISSTPTGMTVDNGPEWTDPRLG